MGGKNRRQAQVASAWLGAGAVTVGVGTALLGAGVAHAEETDAGTVAKGNSHGSERPAHAAKKSGNRAVVEHEFSGAVVRPTNIAQKPKAFTSSISGEQTLFAGRPPSTVDQAVTVGMVNVALTIAGVVSAFDNAAPLPVVTSGLTVTRSEFDDMPVYVLHQPDSTSEKAIVAVHGGGYVGQITIINWVNYADIARETGATVIVPVYPLAPEGTAATVVPATADLIAAAIADHGADNVSVLGESAGGGLALAAAQELVRRRSAVPGRMVLVAPELDVTISDPASQTIRDPLLTVGSLRASGLLWAGDLDPDDPVVSPINGSLDGLPTTYVYSGSLDLLSPQTLRLRDEAPENFTFILRKGEIHGWAAFPFLPQARADRPAIERELLGL